ncbi:hypothetical protein U8607_07935 [Methylobacterium durans]|uniref:hypothetical protein n=1 Tax=Methylobacterium durans TaxID=2202825 RepID=UPI002AFEA823|nr:hypothetical protein [Methylobacterium durans]MEA1832011.1 hypothetical protein [Methylobacterium durans]
MDPSRPLAKRRLLQAIENAFGADDPIRNLSLAELQKKLVALAQEKRFLTFAFLMRAMGHLTSQEIVTAIRDQLSNVLRNLHALVAERLIAVQQDDETGIYRYAVNGDIVRQLAAFFSV